MNFSLITEWPLWFLLFCILLGVAYAAILYYKEKKHDLPEMLKKILALARFFSVTIIAFLLLSPFVKSSVNMKEKPVIIIAQDNSSSLLTGKDSTYYKSDYKETLDEIASELARENEVELYLFGQAAEPVKQGSDFSNDLDYRDKQTNISQVLEEIRTVYSNRNVGALILATDGLYNSGINPLYSLKGISYPIYTVALGDTNQHRDVVLQSVLFNRLVYLDSEFPIEVSLNAAGCKDENVLISLFYQGQAVARQEVRIDQDQFSATHTFVVKASEPGLQRYRVQVSPVDREVTIENNSRNVFIEVLDSRTKILILAQAPHPDITAIKEALKANLNYEVEDFLATGFKEPLESYNMIILHQLPSMSNPASDIIRKIKEKNIPCMVILGPASNISTFNSWGMGAEITQQKKVFEEVLPLVNKSFTRFTLSSPTTQLVEQYPPLNTFLANYQVSNSLNILMYQRIGTVSTQRPLIAFGEDLDRRWGIIFGEGIWKWRLHNYAHAYNHDAFNEIVHKMVQFLAVKENRGQFRVYYENSFTESEVIIMDAELYNDSYELITDPEVEVIIRDEKGDNYPFAFTRRERSYSLNAGNFPPGNYNFTARTSLGQKVFEKQGSFTIQSLDAEKLRTVADHAMLAAMARETGGQLVYPAQIRELSGKLNAREDIKPVIYTQLRYTELVNIPWILAAILLLLIIEWFVRKRAGAY